MQTTYLFRGGPWDGFIIEYDEWAEPDDRVNPREPDRSAGLYHLNGGEATYVWTKPAR
jgi:hypothetical protein